MSKCDKCGKEVGNLYCGKCKEIIRQKEMPAVPSDDLIILLVYDKKTDLYRYGCSVKECPCNLQNGWCSKATPSLMADRIQFRLHPYDGDNCVKQWCG